MSKTHFEYVSYYLSTIKCLLFKFLYDILFCPKCGTKILSIDESNPLEPPLTPPPTSFSIDDTHLKVPKKRKIFSFLSNFCFFGSGIMFLVNFSNNNNDAPLNIIGGAIMYLVFGIMFFVLSKSPKDSPFLFGKNYGIKKTLFISLCIFAIFAIVIFSNN